MLGTFCSTTTKDGKMSFAQEMSKTTSCVRIKFNSEHSSEFLSPLSVCGASGIGLSCFRCEPLTNASGQEQKHDSLGSLPCV